MGNHGFGPLTEWSRLKPKIVFSFERIILRVRDTLCLGSVFLERKAFLSLARDDIPTRGLELRLLVRPGRWAMCRLQGYTNGKFGVWFRSSEYLLSPSTKSIPREAVPGALHLPRWLALADRMQARLFVPIKVETSRIISLLFLLFSPWAMRMASHRMKNHGVGLGESNTLYVSFKPLRFEGYLLNWSMQSNSATLVCKQF